MIPRRIAPLLAVLAAVTLALVRPALAKERSEIPKQYQWDLTALYRSPDAWEAARKDLARRIPALEKYRGRLGASDSLYRALDAMMGVRRDLARLSTYASQLSDQDTRVSRPLEMKQLSEQMGVDYQSATAWVDPEILTLGATRIHALVAKETRLTPYGHYLDDVLRHAPHTLNAEEEKLVAQAGRMENAGNTIRDIFNNAELPWPTVKLPGGETVRLDDAAYTQYRQSASRADRDTVFHVFWRAHREFQNTYGATLNAQVQAHVFEKDVRHFKSCVEASMFGDNIPPRVYTQLLADVHANLPTLHRYLRLRQRMMGLKQLRYEDLYAPLVKDVDRKYTPEQAMETVLAAVRPLGQPYVDTLGHGYRSGWVDWLPTTGKASGAYSTGAYGVHPYQLQNFTGLYDEVGTLAHESGHSMHTYLADRHQPYVTHDYATFVAEVASTLNENLLFHYMLDRTKDKPTRLFLLGTELENLRGTLFRQTMFAEFELKIHEMAEKGETLSGESLSKLYLELARTYYGHAQGVCTVDPLYAVEWAYIPHFFYDFYVYQYATSIVASTSLARGIRDEAAAGRGTAKRDAYLNMLASGSSKYPIDLLKDAGVDMTTSAPFRASMQEMNAVMDEMEKLLASK
jgi:oligoendopeptidase F